MSTVEPIRKISDIEKIEKNLKSKNFRDYVLFKFGVNCGLRISDILKLNIKDVKNKKFILLRETKTKKLRKIPLNKSLKKIFKTYTKDKEANAPLFVSVRGYRLERVSAYRIIRAACLEVGIDSIVGTHTLRKTFGYHFYHKYNNVVMLQKIFNHSNPAITLRYIGITDDEIYKSYMNFDL